MRGAPALATILLVAGGMLIGSARAAAAEPPPVASSPLASNGFESPSCTSPALTSQLSPNQQTNCSVSGIAVAPVPLSNYAIDVNIASGLGASISEDLDSVVQDLLLTPLWTALVWLVHVVLVALEWCYALDLLAPATLARAATALGGAERVFTDPWLGLALAMAAAGFAWQGLVRRRVLDTLGRAALLALMVTIGLWVIADPVGTVGAVGDLADRAALATVAASATGDPQRPVATVDGAFAVVFDAVISGPWCYLEFGDVSWCERPDMLDPHLHAVATQLAALYRAAARCRGPSPGLVACAPAGSALQSDLAATATALDAATTNGALFLALPAGTPARTGLTSAIPTPTLYQTLCGSTDATACTAATALQAEFRTAPGTWARVGGLVLILAGSLGMLLLFGFIALRLLGAALATLLYLMLAPVAVLAPALGDGGRDSFRLWLTRLVGSLLAKLVYSVALGVVLLIVRLLESLDQLGWWTQWLLVSAFWWIAFEHRHRLLSLVIHERGEPARRSPLATRVFVGARTAGAGAGVVRAGARVPLVGLGATIEGRRRWQQFSQEHGIAGARLGSRAFENGGGRGRPGIRDELRRQYERVDGVERATEQASAGPMVAAAPLRLRMARIDRALAVARTGGERRRVISLERRRVEVARRLTDMGAHEPRAFDLARSPRVALARALPQRLSAAVESRARVRLLDRAARNIEHQPLRPGPRATSLAGLAGVTPAAYLRATPARQRALRVEITRELERRRALLIDAEPAPLRLLRAVVAQRQRREPPRTAAEEAIERRRRQFGGRGR